MATVIRKLNKKIWMDSEIAQQLGGLQADALKNFQTTDNTLSIFYVDDVVPPERVAAVIALGGDRLDNVDFVTFDDEILSLIDVAPIKVPGQTVDSCVNQKHVDLTRLTAAKILGLANQIQNEGTCSRITKKQAIKILKNLHEAGSLDVSNIKPGVLSQIT